MPSASPRDLPADEAYLQSMAVEDDLLALEVSYTGGCAEHRFDVEVREWWASEDYIGVELRLLHDSGGDECKALVSEHLAFSLQPLLQDSLKERSVRGGRALFHLPPLTVEHTTAI